MTATVPATADTGQAREESWPAWAPPVAAAAAWAVLQVELEQLGWRVACQADPDAWWSTRKTPAAAELQAAAVEACAWCPVLELCRDYAIAAGEVDGVWGGTTPAARQAARSSR